MRYAILLAVLCASWRAHADTPVDVFLTVQPSDKQAAPTIEATLVGAPKTSLDKISLSTTIQNRKVVVNATRMRDYAEGKETIAIAFVINGQEIWIGNDDIETDDNAKYPGVLNNLEAAIDKLNLGASAPAGSKGMVVSYSQGVDIKVPMGDLKQVTGNALGSQKDYRGKIGTDMVQGISTGLAQLSRVATARKALIVIGDGNDTNNDAAKVALADLKKQATAQGVQMFAIIYKSAVSHDGAVITALIPAAKTVNSIDGIESELDLILARMADRYYVTFPGELLPWDGKDHDIVIKIDQTDLETQPLALAPVWALPQPRHVPWGSLVLAALGVGLVILIARVATRPSAPAAMPVAMAEVAPAPAPAPALIKTAMMAANGDHDGFPIVGWLVPLDGAHAFQTMKLRAGMTRIGTAPPSDIVVHDQFMSTEHCQITSSPQGFLLRDGGSTNGCYVNGKKVDEFDLFDNDEIMLGRTTFRFKSIN